MSSAVDIHRSLVFCNAGRVHLVQEEKAERRHPASPEDGLMGAAAPILMLASYRNQCIHVFVRPAILAAAIHTSRATLRGGDYNPRLCFSKQGGFKGINMAFLSVCRRAVQLLLLPAGRLLQRVHLHPWKVTSGCCLTFLLRKELIKRIRAVKGLDELPIDGFDKQDFKEACSLLRKCGAVHVTQQAVSVSETGREVLEFLQTLLQPFISSYQVILTLIM